MKQIIVSFLTLVLAFSVSASLNPPAPPLNNYCLGEWTDNAEDYCQNVMTYVMSLVVDRNLNQSLTVNKKTLTSKDLVQMDIQKAVQTYRIPANLAHNYIEFIWQYPPRYFSPEEAANIMFGGCIDNFEILKEQ